MTDLRTQTRVARTERTGSRVTRLCYADGYARVHTPIRRARRVRAGAPAHARSRTRRRTLGAQVWSQTDPRAELAYGTSPYSVNGANPISNADPHGDAFPAMLLGAGLGVVGNGIGNLLNDRPFFQGAGQAAFFGAFTGGVASGIGATAATMAANGVSQAGVAAFQVGAHGFTGGVMSVAQGGTFAQGALSGGLSSGISSGIGALGGGPWAQVAGGTLSGGLGAEIAGGDFWKGAVQGAITSGLNHGAHAGLFGEGLAASLYTGRLRHILGPDAIGAFGSVDGAAGVGVHGQKSGVFMLRGKDAGKFQAYTEIGGHLGIEVGGAIGVERFYYTDAVRNISITQLGGWSTQISLSAGIGGFDVGASVSRANIGGGQFILGVGSDIGVSPLPIKLSGTVGQYWNFIE